MTDLVCQGFELEQRSEDRAKYGSGLLAKVSRRLPENDTKGCSASRLKLYRQFYQQHRQLVSHCRTNSPPRSPSYAGN